jgi:hypothetical protein
MPLWMCTSCKHRYPPCASGCGVKRPCRQKMYCVQNMPLWTCSALAESDRQKQYARMLKLKKTGC